jgi:hypothetical protein
VSNPGAARNLSFGTLHRVADRSSAVRSSYRPDTDDLTTVDWLVEAPPGTVVAVTARHARAGTVRSELALG